MKEVKRNILLNPGPATTTDSVKLSMVVPDICPRELEFGELTLSVRDDLIKIARGVNTHTCVLLTSSGTGGVEAVLTSVIPKEKTILILNNGSYGQRMEEICEAYSIEFLSYKVVPGNPINLEEVETIIKNNADSLSHVAFVHHETTVGILNPLKKICDLTHKYNLENIVDAMSSFAGVDIDVQRDNVDYLVSSSNKCIQAMAGISFVICRITSLEKTLNIKRNFYFNLLENHKYLSINKQFLFTPPVQTLYALRQAIDEFFVESLENRIKRYKTMYDIMIEELETLHFKFLVDKKYHSKLLTSIIEPNSKKYNFNEMHDFLLERGFTIYPGKVGHISTFRLSNIGEIYPSDIKEFFKHFKEYLKLKEII